MIGIHLGKKDNLMEEEKIKRDLIFFLQREWIKQNVWKMCYEVDMLKPESKNHFGVSQERNSYFFFL